MVSGEDMCIPRKNETARQVQWKVTGILAGNQVPSWSDNARSIARRIVVWEFTRRPENTDTKLGEHLGHEMASILLKCNRAYLEAVQKVGQDSVEKHLPEYFRDTNSMLVDEVDSFRNLMKSGKLRFGCDKKLTYMPFRDFVALYNKHCRDNGFKFERVNKTNYAGPFFEVGAVVQTDTRDWPRLSGCDVNDKWILGMEPTRSE
jgi:phage/plasmid-associated DNA primase